MLFFFIFTQLVCSKVYSTMKLVLQRTLKYAKGRFLSIEQKVLKVTVFFTFILYYFHLLVLAFLGGETIVLINVLVLFMILRLWNLVIVYKQAVQTRIYLVQQHTLYGNFTIIVFIWFNCY